MDQADRGDLILPPELPSLQQAWSRAHLRLHRTLLRQPQLLPQRARLLLAVSGGQDSMALTGLLLGLQRLHHWELVLWHGNHNWRPEAALQAAELGHWCARQGLKLHSDSLEPASLQPGGNREATARDWRYRTLAQHAQTQACSHVLTAHTASDRAETLLLHLARGSHRRGLASLASQRPFSSTVMLCRPLLIFSRAETAQICAELGLPVWPDPSNDDLGLSRNRVRHEVLPVLEALHPGASRRLCGTAERLHQELQALDDWHAIALQWLANDASCGQPGLDRQRLCSLQPINQGAVLACWLQQHTGTAPGASQLEALLQRCRRGQPPGSIQLSDGWQLHWDRSRLVLTGPSAAARR